MHDGARPRQDRAGDRPAPAARPSSLEIAAFRPSALIFDLDGTMLDNMSLHAEAFAVFAARHGLPPLTPADRVRLDGKRNSEIFPVLFGRVLDDDEWRAFEEEKESLYREISLGRLRPLRGFERLLARADTHGLPVAIATSAPAANVEHSLRETGLGRLTAVVVRGDQVPRGKPAPDVFLAAADLAGVAADRCLAFEDAPAGVAAARAAGMACVALTTSFAAGALAAQSEPPDLCVAHYDDFLQGAGRWLLDAPRATSARARRP
jgi:HAD superfamily hydrolase (TIGR01509 family)